jgi:hydroxymethylbilane synthase
MSALIRIATRSSALALAQTELAIKTIKAKYPISVIEVIKLTTKADKNSQTPIHEIGGKGIFVKELEQALLEQKADVAVHSVKDMPSKLTAELSLPCILERSLPHDILISKQNLSLSKLAPGSIVGTSSIRRELQLKLMRPDLIYKPIRGNVGTRIKKIGHGYDAIILAYAGIARLQLTEHITENFKLSEMLPAAGQAAIGLQCLTQNDKIMNMLTTLDHKASNVCITAERSAMENLGAHCFAPVAAYAEHAEDKIKLHAKVFTNTGHIQTTQTGPCTAAYDIGKEAAVELIHQGALDIISKAKE